jgi:copper homeostasis protein
LIRKLVDTAGNRIIIMPGGGLNEKNILEVASTTGASEFHLTGRNRRESNMKFVRQGIGLGHPAMAEEEYRLRFADTELIQRIRRTLEK